MVFPGDFLDRQAIGQEIGGFATDVLGVTHGEEAEVAKRAKKCCRKGVCLVHGLGFGANFLVRETGKGIADRALLI